MIANRFNPLGVSLVKPYAYRVEYVRGHYGGSEVGLYVVSNYIPQLDDHFILEGDNYFIGTSFFGTVGSGWRRYAFANYGRTMWVGEKDRALGVGLPEIKKLEYKDRKVYVNGEYKVDFSDATEEPIRPINIFALPQLYSQAGIYFSDYEFKKIEVYRNGELYRHFYPVVDLEGNAAIYEEVEGVLLYGSSRGGTFALTAGPRI